ncbi:S-adenosyl-L-methionine-dependent methyltransferase [Nemania sp. FL0031]|nr:S-adenosyl-L-methionine-dependent methyltransferase [Nemania sp. FL0031]
MTADFEKQSYWHDRFKTEEAFEWLVTSYRFMHYLKPYLSESKSQRILHLGSGTSDLHTYLRWKGYDDVTNVDYEPLALERGQDLEAKAFNNIMKHKYVVADVTKLDGKLAPGAFDLVLDKSTADSVSCAGEAAVRDMAKGVRQCLALGGVWISLSYSATRFRIADLPFEVSVIEKILFPKEKETEPDVFYWCYLLRPR